jgi:hypothetical protein
MDRRSRQTPAGDGSSGFEQLPNLANRAPGIIPFGRQNRGLDGLGKLRLPAVGARLRHQAIEALGSVGVPPLNRLLAQMAPTGAGNSVFTYGQI